MRISSTMFLTLALPLGLIGARGDNPSKSPPAAALPATAAKDASAARRASSRDVITGTIDGPTIVGALCPCYNYSVDPSGGTPPYTYEWMNGSTASSISNYGFSDTGGINETQVVVDIWDSNGGHGVASKVVRVCPFPEFDC